MRPLSPAMPKPAVAAGNLLVQLAKGTKAPPAKAPKKVGVRWKTVVTL